MRLLSLPSEVQLALKEGIISMGHAKAIAGLSEDNQLKALKKCIKKSLSVRQMELFARKLNETPVLSTTNDDEEYPEVYSHLVDELERIFSENISIKRTKNGSCKITIECANDHEIDRIIKRLSSVK
jgi:ParB family chromosome partitioning protein